MKSQFNLFGRGLPLRIAITFSCQLAFVLFGYDQGVFSGIVGNADFLDTFGHPDSGLEGIIVSIYNLGCFSGCILAFFVCEKLGRRKSMWLAMVFIIVGAILQTTAFSVPHLMIARYVTGIGTGIETSTVPAYQSELCEADKRGRLVSSEPLFVGVGIEIAYWFDHYYQEFPHILDVCRRLKIDPAKVIALDTEFWKVVKKLAGGEDGPVYTRLASYSFVNGYGDIVKSNYVAWEEDEVPKSKWSHISRLSKDKIMLNNPVSQAEARQDFLDVASQAEIILVFSGSGDLQVFGFDPKSLDPALDRVVDLIDQRALRTVLGQKPGDPPLSLAAITLHLFGFLFQEPIQIKTRVGDLRHCVSVLPNGQFSGQLFRHLKGHDDDLDALATVLVGLRILDDLQEVVKTRVRDRQGLRMVTGYYGPVTIGQDVQGNLVASTPSSKPKSTDPFTSSSNTSSATFHFPSGVPLPDDKSVIWTAAERHRALVPVPVPSPSTDQSPTDQSPTDQSPTDQSPSATVTPPTVDSSVAPSQKRSLWRRLVPSSSDHPRDLDKAKGHSKPRKFTARMFNAIKLRTKKSKEDKSKENSKADGSEAENSKADGSEAEKTKAGGSEAEKSKAGGSEAGKSKAGGSEAENSKAGGSEAGKSKAVKSSTEEPTKSAGVTKKVSTSQPVPAPQPARDDAQPTDLSNPVLMVSKKDYALIKSEIDSEYPKASRIHRQGPPHSRVPTKVPHVVIIGGFSHDTNIKRLCSWLRWDKNLAVLDYAVVNRRQYVLFFVEGTDMDRVKRIITEGATPNGSLYETNILRLGKDEGQIFTPRSLDWSTLPHDQQQDALDASERRCKELVAADQRQKEVETRSFFLLTFLVLALSGLWRLLGHTTHKVRIPLSSSPPATISPQRPTAMDSFPSRLKSFDLSEPRRPFFQFSRPTASDVLRWYDWWHKKTDEKILADRNRIWWRSFAQWVERMFREKRARRPYDPALGGTPYVVRAGYMTSDGWVACDWSVERVMMFEWTPDNKDVTFMHPFDRKVFEKAQPSTPSQTLQRRRSVATVKTGELPSSTLEEKNTDLILNYLDPVDLGYAHFVDLIGPIWFAQSRSAVYRWLPEIIDWRLNNMGGPMPILHTNQKAASTKRESRVIPELVYLCSLRTPESDDLREKMLEAIDKKILPRNDLEDQARTNVESFRKAVFDRSGHPPGETLNQD